MTSVLLDAKRIRWYMSRDEKSKVLSLRCTWYLQPDALCSPPGSHRNARSPKTLSPGTTLHKAGQANKSQILSKVPSTRDSEENGTGQDRKAGSRRISRDRLGSSLTSEPSRNLRPPFPHRARTLVVRHVEGLPAATRLRSQRRGVDGEAG